MVFSCQQRTSIPFIEYPCFNFPRESCLVSVQQGLQGTEIERFSCKNILLVIGPKINSLPLSQEIRETLEGIGTKITIYDEIPSEPTEDIAEDIAGFVRDNTFDLVVGFGGGSVLDYRAMLEGDLRSQK